MPYRTDEELRSLQISENASLKDGLKQMDAIRNNLIVIIDDSGNFIGIITDGDFRRALLRGLDYSTPLKEFTNKSPFHVQYDTNFMELAKTIIISKRIRHLPVIKDEKLYDVIYKTDIEEKSHENISDLPKLNNPVVIMAGGKGTRLDPFTRILPKPLLPIGDKTILEVIIDKFLPYSIHDFYLTVNYKAIVIKSYFEELKPDYNLHFIEEDMPLGTGGALKYLEGKFDVPIIVTNCDILVEAYYSDLVKHHITNQNDITMVASVKHYNIPYGICEIENGGELKEIKEKPEYSFLVNTGMYVLNPEVISKIPPNKFYHITHLMEQVKIDGGKVGLYPVSENDWMDVGEWDVFNASLKKII